MGLITEVELGKVCESSREKEKNNKSSTGNECDTEKLKQVEWKQDRQTIKNKGMADFNSSSFLKIKAQITENMEKKILLLGIEGR